MSSVKAIGCPTEKFVLESAKLIGHGSIWDEEVALVY